MQEQLCPICGKPYIKSRPTPFGGMEYVHKEEETFSDLCSQSSASYKASLANPSSEPENNQG